MENTLRALKFISSPFDRVLSEPQGWNNSTHGPDSVLLSIVSKCRELLELGQCGQNMSENCGPLTPTWLFTSTAVNLLLQLRLDVEEMENNQPEEEKNIQVLSIQVHGDIQKCVEFVIGFGVVPYLLPDVGVPEKVRKRNRAAFDLFLNPDNQLLPLIKFHRLAQVVDGLLQVCSNPSLAALIIPKHASDILSALLQICKSPISKNSKKRGALTEVEYNYVMVLRDRFQRHLSVYLSSIPKSILINSVFLVGEKPKFMREVCTSIIEEIMISPNGLILISSTLLSESSVSNVWSLARIVSNLMISSLKHARETQTGYLKDLFENMCSQCVQMIWPSHLERTSNCEAGISPLNTTDHTNTSSPQPPSTALCVNQELARIGLFCSIALMDVDCQMSKLLLWDHLFKPVSLLGQGQGKEYQCGSKEAINRNAPPSAEENLTHEDLITCVDIDRVIAVSEVAEGLLSLLSPTGISIPLHAFQSYWSLLFQACIACWKYLERKVQEPEVSQLAQVLNNKLSNVFILLVEVVSAGLGDKLDLNNSNANAADKQSTAGNPQKEKVDDDSGVNNIISSLMCAKKLTQFCVTILVNEYTDIARLELVSVIHDNTVKVKIGHVSKNCAHNNGYELSSGCKPSSSASTTSSCENSNIPNHSDSTIFEILTEECTILCSILKHERVSHITSQLFRYLLNYENEDIEKQQRQRGSSSQRQKGAAGPELSERTISSQDLLFCKEEEGASSSKATTAITSKELTQLEHTLEGHGETELFSLQKFVALKLLEELGKDDQILESCVNTDDYKETLLIVELVIRRLTMELRESCNSGQAYEFSQTIVFALGFLGTIVETGYNICGTSNGSSSLVESDPKSRRQNGADDEFWSELHRFIPDLRIIADSDDVSLVNLGIPSMAENILISIESRGEDGSLGKSGKKKVMMSLFQKALEDIGNPMLPIKGHGLLQLRRLIESMDDETLKNDSLLLQIFQTELNNEDSYVYLMSIQGLAALGLKFHNITIPILIQEYDIVNPGVVENEGQKREKLYKTMTVCEKIECRMKIGEVLVKVVQQLGEIAPVYKVPLTNLLFRIVRDDEPLIRASALSNLGELCHLLKFSLGFVLTEVWHNVEAILSCEKNIHVRRAALHLLVLMLKGIEKEFSPNHLLTDVQLGGYLRDARRLLTRIEQREIDLVGRTHAQLALQELELIVKKLLVPKQELCYKIRVFDSID